MKVQLLSTCKTDLWSYSVKVDCPKCGSHNAWYHIERYDVTLKCLCGVNKVVETTLESITTIHVDTPKEVTLPRKDTKIYRCMMVLHAIAPATSLEVTNKLNELLNGLGTLTVDEVSSQLTVLRYKGVVEPIEYRKGILGGSTWVVTPLAQNKLNGT